MEVSKVKSEATRKLVLSGILIAIATVLGTFSIPILGAKASPIQHLINVISGVTLGPVYGLLCAFVSSLLRNILGTGSILAFPGSMVGVLLAGLLYKKFKKVELAVIGEVVGTGIIGALLAYPLAAFVLGREVALFVYIVPFSLSSIVGSLIAYIILKIKVIREFLLK
ncbi:energy coupling factor transporter S component ThiW [Clostridium celatum]|uniref:Protein ThiW n=1 Tax=Clostridium celatum DSM 1785 TaxID=545697 RepID=L1QDS6_9CLOT|nr:energy coupling factor transporter S component ThiW [Clostridium celatum]EKY25810.1 protein ThiW [Clostridium celatum DSM 1785]MCE9653665.1 energy coupling factor transporter S component ThiW [Clostridium celatum]MDU3723801.1 energy coupling factor transporter S component ThiW [Clostridium celatum]MDY3361340.1 energy coupling factor transporter S component ThiW [Clostridium celatum]